MKRNGWIVSLAAFGSIFVLAQVGGWALAQDDSYEIAYEEVYGKKQRPAVTFPHGLHMEVLDCGECHHEYDEDEGKLVPVEDPFEGCTGCHGAEKEDNEPALREAFHGQCTGCHRKTIKQGEDSGPTTCGECHKR